MSNASRRVNPLPADWRTRRMFVLERDGFRCRAILPSGARCAGEGTDVDHIHPLEGDSYQNLQTLCGYHHRLKTASEAGRKVHKRARMPHKSKRRGEKHPGDPN